MQVPYESVMGLIFSSGKRSGYCMILQCSFEMTLSLTRADTQSAYDTCIIVYLYLSTPLSRDHFCCTKPKRNDIVGYFHVKDSKKHSWWVWTEGGIAVSIYLYIYILYIHVCASSMSTSKHVPRLQAIELDLFVVPGFQTSRFCTWPNFLNPSFPPRNQCFWNKIFHGGRYVPQSGQWLMGLSTLRANLQPKPGARRCLAGHGESEVAWNGSHTSEIFGVGIDGNLRFSPWDAAFFRTLMTSHDTKKTDISHQVIGRFRFFCSCLQS